MLGGTWQLMFNYKAIDLFLFSSILEAGRGNGPFLSANIRQGNECAVLIAEKMNQLPLSFITLFFFFYEGEKNSNACVLIWQPS